MPSAGGIAAPVLTPLRSSISGKPAHCIDTGTYIEMATESTNCHIFFTTDGTRPDPEKRRINGREVTFKYKAPFCLKSGKRIIKAIAMHRVTRQLSVVTTRTYHVEEVHGWDQVAECMDADGAATESSAWDSDADDGLHVRKRRGGARGGGYGGSGGIGRSGGMGDSGGIGADGSPVAGRHREAWGGAGDVPGLGDELGVPPDQGFSAVNHSGTQINLYGGSAGSGATGGPFGWEVRAPNNVNFRGGFPQQQPALPPPPPEPQPSLQGVTPQQLNAIASQLTQRMDETRQSTLLDIKRMVEDTKKQQQVERIKGDPTCQPVSKGNGDFKKQLQHVHAHLLQFSRTDAAFQAAMGDTNLGKVLSAELDESDDSFLLMVHIGKPGFRKPLHAPKTITKPSNEPKPKPFLPSSKNPAKTESSLTRRRQPTPPPNHQVETEVKQTANEKADAITLKTEEKPPEEVEEAYFEQEEYVQEGTLKPFSNFNAGADAEQLRKAMKGFGTDEQSIINVLGARTISQRAEIVRTFKMKFGKDLKKDLDSELSGNFNKICQNLCLGAAEYDAMELREAMKGLGTDEDCLIEIVCTRTQAQIEEVKRVFKSMYNRDLEEDVMSETSGHFKRLLVSLLTGARPEGSSFDPEQVKRDAQELKAAGLDKWGTDESKFNEILCGNNNAHLRAVFAEYEQLSGKTLEDSLESEMSGDVLQAMLTLVRCIQNKPAYFAKALHKSMKGLGTNDKILLRIVITRCEVDMVQIKDAFQKEFGQSLAEWIKDDTSGDYRKILLALIGDS